MDRRNFLKYLATLPIAVSATQASAIWHGERNNYLIMLELKGGNDSLNTFIPRKDPLYYSQRPSIAIPKEKSIKITSELSLNASLRALAKQYANGDMAIFNNVGYPKSNKSHFTSLAIVEKAVSGKNGWAYEAMKGVHGDLDGVVFSGSDGLFDAQTPNFIKMRNIKNFVRQSRGLRIKRSSNPQVIKYNHTKSLIKASANILQSGPLDIETYTPSNPDSRFAEQFVQIAKIIKSDIDMPILKLHLSGFDTHADQVSRQSELLGELDVSVNEFISYLKSQNLWDNSLIYSFSEFGRRIAENGNGGTDHGEAYTGFALGGRVIGGVYGDMPNLDSKNIKYSIDHRQLLHTLETNWLKRSRPTDMVASFSKIGFVST